MDRQRVFGLNDKPTFNVANCGRMIATLFLMFVEYELFVKTMNVSSVIERRPLEMISNVIGSKSKAFLMRITR